MRFKVVRYDNRVTKARIFKEPLELRSREEIAEEIEASLTYQVN